MFRSNYTDYFDRWDNLTPEQKQAVVANLNEILNGGLESSVGADAIVTKLKNHEPIGYTVKGYQDDYLEPTLIKGISLLESQNKVADIWYDKDGDDYISFFNKNNPDNGDHFTLSDDKNLTADEIKALKGENNTPDIKEIQDTLMNVNEDIEIGEEGYLTPGSQGYIDKFVENYHTLHEDDTYDGYKLALGPKSSSDHDDNPNTDNLQEISVFVEKGGKVYEIKSDGPDN